MAHYHFPVKSSQLQSLVSKINVRVRPTPRRYPNPDEPGLGGRLKVLRKVVTALIKYERLELRYHKGDECRGYAERLISEAIRHGDLHRPTMDLAKFWITDEAAVPKLFKVLVPRYKTWPVGLPFTRMLRTPACVKDYHDLNHLNAPIFAVLELRGNPYPPLPGPVAKPHPGAIHNVLLEEARKDYFKSQSKIEGFAEREINAIPIPDEEGFVENTEATTDSPVTPDDLTPPRH